MPTTPFVKVLAYWAIVLAKGWPNTDRTKPCRSLTLTPYRKFRYIDLSIYRNIEKSVFRCINISNVSKYRTFDVSKYRNFDISNVPKYRNFDVSKYCISNFRYIDISDVFLPSIAWLYRGISLCRHWTNLLLTSQEHRNRANELIFVRRHRVEVDSYRVVALVTW